MKLIQIGLSFRTIFKKPDRKKKQKNIFILCIPHFAISYESSAISYSRFMKKNSIHEKVKQHSEAVARRCSVKRCS